ncbi:Dynein light chain 1 cytoplasmic [Taenia crassiceps]|uniref:Dynein light chain 1 cytoplasmic n=1 Tax=Taenia crassiceps TaxID=6207 RepID=A0ABR4QLZ7_9CEST
MGDKQILNIQSDMTNDRRQEMEQIVSHAVQTEGLDNIKGIARTVKGRCEDRFGGNWNCHVGTFFGSSFPYEAGTYFYAEIGNICVLVYKFQ